MRWGAANVGSPNPNLVRSPVMSAPPQSAPNTETTDGFFDTVRGPQIKHNKQDPPNLCTITPIDRLADADI